VSTLVVGWDGNIDELSWGIGIAEGNNWNVDVGSLLDSLSIGAGIGNNDEAGFFERAGDIIGEVTWGETTGNWRGTSVRGELENSTLTVRASRNDTDIGGVINGNDDTGSLMVD
jgi:hypothetical protein